MPRSGARSRARRLRPEALVIGLLHSYAAPGDERRLARRGAPARRAGDGVFRAVSRDPGIRALRDRGRECVPRRRASRATLDALLTACGPRLEIVLSHGGSGAGRAALREPVRQLLSGPAAGSGRGVRAARAAGFARRAHARRGRDLDRRRVRAAIACRGGGHATWRGSRSCFRMLDVHTVGAGGGSIAAIDAGGLLAVGPAQRGRRSRSGLLRTRRAGHRDRRDGRARAIAGPPRSGTVRSSIRPERAGAALARLARGLGVGSALEAARAVVAVANARMEAALRRVSVERGHDPRTAVLVAFGGAGDSTPASWPRRSARRAWCFPRTPACSRRSARPWFRSATSAAAR